MNQEEKEKVPLFKSWRGWYWFVIIILVAEIFFFNWFTRAFS